MKRVRMPPSIFTLSIVLSGLVNLGLSLVVLFAIMLAVDAPLHAALWPLPIAVLLVGVFTFGASLARSRMREARSKARFGRWMKS